MNIFNITPATLCYCGSRKPAIDCCLAHRRPKRPRSKTGRRNRKCYAAALGDCSPRIAKEHYISRGVLDLFGDPLDVKGFPWLGPGETRIVAVADLTGHVLCERHNNLLGGLDQVAIRFARTILDARSDKYKDLSVAYTDSHMFNGDDLERWVLKVVCGLAASGNANIPSKSWKLPLSWLKILFEEQPFPPGHGLYHAAKAGMSYEIPSRIFVAVMYADDEIKGAIIMIRGLRFIFMMTNPDSDRVRAYLEHHNYRMSLLSIVNGLTKHTLLVTWDQPGDGGEVTMDWVPKPGAAT
jgi:hypothetical protein